MRPAPESFQRKVAPQVVAAIPAPCRAAAVASPPLAPLGASVAAAAVLDSPRPARPQWWHGWFRRRRRWRGFRTGLLRALPDWRIRQRRGRRVRRRRRRWCWRGIDYRRPPDQPGRGGNRRLRRRQRNQHRRRRRPGCWRRCLRPAGRLVDDRRRQPRDRDGYRGAGAGDAGTGQHLGDGLFIQGTQTITFSGPATQTTVAGVVADEAASGGTGVGSLLIRNNASRRRRPTIPTGPTTSR